MSEQMKKSEMNTQMHNSNSTGLSLLISKMGVAIPTPTGW